MITKYIKQIENFGIGIIILSFILLIYNQHIIHWITFISLTTFQSIIGIWFLTLTSYIQYNKYIEEGIKKGVL